MSSVPFLWGRAARDCRNSSLLPLLHECPCNTLSKRFNKSSINPFMKQGKAAFGEGPAKIRVKITLEFTTVKPALNSAHTL